MTASDGAPAASPQETDRRAVGLIFLTIVIDLIGVGILFPILPFMALEYDADARLITLLIATHGATQMLFAPVWGRLSDRWGRKRLLLIAFVASGIAYIWFGLAGSLVGLFLARAFSGAMAGNVAVAQAFIADVTSREGRSAGMAKIGAAFGLGFVLGPALGGALSGNDPAQPNFLLPCLVAAGLSFLASLLGLLLLREPARRVTRASTPGLGEVLATLSQWPILVLIVLSLLLSLAFSQTISIYPLWLEAEFSWGPKQVGYAFTYVGIIVAVLQGVLIGPLARLIGEARVLLIGAVAFIAGLSMIPTVTALPTLVLQMTAVSIGLSLCQPILSGLISRATPADSQGATLGVANLGSGFGRIFGPPLAGLTFAGIGPDAPFFMATLVLVPVLARALWMATRGGA